MRTLASWSAPFALALLLASCGGNHGSGSGSGSGTGAGTSGTGAGTTTGTSSGTGGGTNPPPPTCPDPIQPADVSSPTTVVGTGTEASCTEAALVAAVAKGGVITFDCGATPATITVTSQLEVKTDTVIDGGGTVSLSGGGKTRILHVASAWNVTSPKLTVQHLVFSGGFTTDAMNTKATTQGGAAIFREGGTLAVIDCQFLGNKCATTGQDVSGGAVTSQGVGDTTIVGSTFDMNQGSNGGGVGNLGNTLTVVNSQFLNNTASGTDGNPGNGGNGGAIVFDGQMTTMTICGSTFRANSANAAGGAIFRVAYTDEPTTIDRCTFDGNLGNMQTCNGGALYLENTHIVMTATTISNNSSHYGGGFWIGETAVAELTNVTVSGNDAMQGGGFWFANPKSGTFLNCTIADNMAGYGASVFSGANPVSIQNSIVSNGNCKNGPFPAGGGNLGFMGGDMCVSGGITGDPLLGPLQDNGGPVRTMLPGAGSPAIGKATMSCPPTDARGQPRKTPCTLGAVEAG